VVLLRPKTNVTIVLLGMLPWIMAVQYVLAVGLAKFQLLVYRLVHPVLLVKLQIQTVLRAWIVLLANLKATMFVKIARKVIWCMVVLVSFWVGVVYRHFFSLILVFFFQPFPLYHFTILLSFWIKKGYAQSANGQPSCAICAPGKKRQNTGASNPEGLFTACADCDSGNYQNEQGQNNCKSCTAGYYSGASAAAASCTNCIPGKYSVSNFSIAMIGQCTFLSPNH
jgi:hypothetical protein